MIDYWLALDLKQQSRDNINTFENMLTECTISYQANSISTPFCALFKMLYI